jgi:hypothetical protein
MVGLTLKLVPLAAAALYASLILSGCQVSGPMFNAKPSIPLAEANLMSFIQVL